jgi:hypothetical protein
MLCPSCNNFRPANNVPCPLCHAPSPLGNDAQGNHQASFPTNSWGGPAGSGSEWNNPSEQLPFSATGWQGPPQAAGQQLPFPQTPQTGNLWMQVMSPSNEQQGGKATGQSLLPVPYQDATKSNSLMLLPTAFPTINPGVQRANPLLPALPDSAGAPVYVPPMYTKPRPITPRYRAISGLISMIVVSALLCTGAIYYAQVTGKLVFIQQMLGNYTPSKISVAQNMLPVPGTQVTPGPVWNKVVTSAAIGTSVDPNSNQIPVFVNQFTVGQVIYVSCSINSTTAGKILVKWYTGNQYYQSLTSPPVNANQSQTASFHMTYSLPTEGRVEIYWTGMNGSNPQLAVALLFVVEPEA